MIDPAKDILKTFFDKIHSDSFNEEDIKDFNACISYKKGPFEIILHITNDNVILTKKLINDTI